MELVMNPGDNLWLIIIAIVVIAIIAFLLLRPRQRVQLSESTPLRPHMIGPKPEAEGRGLDGEAAAAASDVVGEIIGAPVHEALAGGEHRDELTQLKGVGPKFAEALHALGICRFEQLARLTPVEIERLDTQLGPFRGRIQRDRLVEQADYLARGDRDGFEERFGKL
jgi:predicted flap endonuclease-1-like 5' DNA nuclease/cbb3-type cytochrome oxidase subunit 3